MSATMRFVSTVMVLLIMAAPAHRAAAQSSVRMTIGGGFGGTAPVGDRFDSNGPGWAAQTHLGVSSSSWPVGFQAELFLASLARDRTTFEQAPAVRITAGTLTVQLPILAGSRGGGLIAAAGGGLYQFRNESPGPLADVTRTNETGVVAGLAYRRVLTAFDVGIAARVHMIFTEDDQTRLLTGFVTIHVPILGR